MEHLIELTETEIAAVAGGWGEMAFVLGSLTNYNPQTAVSVGLGNDPTATKGQGGMGMAIASANTVAKNVSFNSQSINTSV